MTTDQAYRRLVAEADRLQAAGHHAAAHGMRRDAAEFARLAERAKELPILARREGRFQINPGPLRVVPARQRQWGRSTYDLTQEVRCKARTRLGARCERTQEPNSDYCWQHGGRS